MAITRSTQHGKRTRGAPATLAKALAPEDVRPGDYVTPLDEVAEVPSFYWDCDEAMLPRAELVRIRFLPAGGGVPLKVKGVCLPFVLVKHACGQRETLDVRRCRLARLNRTYAAAAWKAYKKKGSAKRARK